MNSLGNICVHAARVAEAEAQLLILGHETFHIASLHSESRCRASGA